MNVLKVKTDTLKVDTQKSAGKSIAINLPNYPILSSISCMLIMSKSYYPTVRLEIAEFAVRDVQHSDSHL